MIIDSLENDNQLPLRQELEFTRLLDIIAEKNLNKWGTQNQASRRYRKLSHENSICAQRLFTIAFSISSREMRVQNRLDLVRNTDKCHPGEIPE